MPEFIPAALFNDLNLPEVTIELPGRDEKNWESMPILSALREFAPGKVTRRFGVRHGSISHWVRPGDRDGAGNGLEIGEAFPEEGAEDLGQFRYRDDDVITSTACYRPWRLVADNTPGNVRVSSRGEMIWKSQLLPSTPPVDGDLPYRSPWASLVHSLGVFSHRHGNPIEMRRFSIGAKYRILIQGGQEPVSDSIRFVKGTDDTPEPVAVGYTIDVDALRLEVNVPADLWARVSAVAPLLAALRSARFARLLQVDPELDGLANTFQRTWLHQISLAALHWTASRKNLSMEVAAESLFDDQAASFFRPPSMKMGRFKAMTGARRSRICWKVPRSARRFEGHRPCSGKHQMMVGSPG